MKDWIAHFECIIQLCEIRRGVAITASGRQVLKIRGRQYRDLHLESVSVYGASRYARVNPQWDACHSPICQDPYCGSHFVLLRWCCLYLHFKYKYIWMWKKWAWHMRALCIAIMKCHMSVLMHTLRNKPTIKAYIQFNACVDVTLSKPYELTTQFQKPNHTTVL